MKKHIPNALTGANLFCGSLACISFIENQAEFGIILIFASLIFDFFDGFAARLLKVQSAIGKELDSLADVISFGLVPGIILFQTIGSSYHPELQYIGLLIPVFSAYRLAKFNLDTRQSDQFIGLPTPANTMFFLSIPMIEAWSDTPSEFGFILNNGIILSTLSLLFSYLLVAELPLIALKFKNFKWKGNEFRFILLISSVILLVSFSFLAGVFIILLYLLLSIINNLSTKNK